MSNQIASGADPPIRALTVDDFLSHTKGVRGVDLIGAGRRLFERVKPSGLVLPVRPGVHVEVLDKEPSDPVAQPRSFGDWVVRHPHQLRVLGVT